MYSLSLTKLKTEGQTKEQKTLAERYKTEIKILASTGLTYLSFKQLVPYLPHRQTVRSVNKINLDQQC